MERGAMIVGRLLRGGNLSGESCECGAIKWDGYGEWD